MSDEEAQEHFDNFFEDVFAECEDKVRDNVKHFSESSCSFLIIIVWRN